MPFPWRRKPSFEGRDWVARGALLVDVRTPSEFAEGHIDGAINIPIQELKQRLEELGDRGRPIVLCCRSGRRSAMAAQCLTFLGFSEVFDLGAIDNWPSAARRGGSP
jgi:phage shock protein E